ncbi:MAG: NAD-dependent epimerase/dehydratase family protein [Nitrosomonadales bacterium]|nr:NAD-dependent epimerase/dehydratase family protein [Nitrosomonadales bacterium]
MERLCLVTGATGFVGGPLCRRLLDDGWRVRAAVRTLRPFPEFAGRAFETVQVGEVGPDTDWSAALAGVECVFHLAADGGAGADAADLVQERLHRTNVLGTAQLARAACEQQISRLVYLGTIKTNGEQTAHGAAYTENTLPAPTTLYGSSKWEAEQALWSTLAGGTTSAVVIRPPLVYGPQAKGNFLQLLKIVSKGIPLPLSGVDNRRSLIYLENLLDALVCCAVHPVAAGKTYLVDDGEAVSTARLITLIAQAMGVTPRLFYCPAWIMFGMGRLTGKTEQVQRLFGSLVVDSGRINKELGWSPPCTMEQGVDASVAWYRQYNK